MSQEQQCDKPRSLDALAAMVMTGEPLSSSERLRIAGAVTRTARAVENTQSHVASSGDGKLTEPAWIGNTSFGVGCSERLVIDRAQREFKYQTAPEREKERIERGAKALAEFQAAVSTTRHIPAYYIAVHTGGEPYNEFDFPVADKIGFKLSPNGAWMRAHDVMKAFAASAIVFSEGELDALIDFHDWNEAGADAMEMPEAAEHHGKRSAYFKAMRDALQNNSSDGGKQTDG